MTESRLHSEETPYTIQSEAHRIFSSIVHDPRLNVPKAIQRIADTVMFVGAETKPFFPVPHKCAETQAGLLGYVGLLSLAISRDRYGTEQRVEVDVEHALLNGLGALFTRHKGEWLSGSPEMIGAVQRWDHGETRQLYRQLATNIYKSKDGRWYALHGSMNPTPLLEMLRIPQHDEKNRSWTEILEMYSEVVGKLDSSTLDNWSNNVYRVPGTICFEEEEFKASPHGKAVKEEPYYNLLRQTYYTQPPVPWDTIPFDPADPRPLSGVKVLELARAIAAPTIGKVFASLGATVIRVSSSTNTELPITLMDGCLGKTSVDINLKTFEGRKQLLDLIRDADIFIDGYRPAVLEHLGFGRDAVLGLVADRKKGIVYCQENCYGWKGPWSTRPGWAQIADTVCGVGYDIGRFNGFDEPHIFPGPNADYLTGHAGAAGVLHALYYRARQGGSFVVQCSLLASNLHMQSYGKYSEQQIKDLKVRNEGLVGHLRHYDEIVSHGKNQHAIRGFVADRKFEQVFREEYFQKTEGKMWGLSDIDVVAPALKYKAVGSDGSSKGMRTDFLVGACPPGYHLPSWERTENEHFQPISSSPIGRR
ncbi:CoA-transferase family III [Plenodomus tracheiphilus IPT5]|uniref:CoA-transferase family III n=1 Tax=Plenodomus tracheiphilus IPT5 TaxID=1408161 RepID=A0A6A7AWW6_9PLEO|nr:CoA-transferase family III [Plenodomus tracheiphilus IPT5]